MRSSTEKIFLLKIFSFGHPCLLLAKHRINEDKVKVSYAIKKNSANLVLPPPRVQVPEAPGCHPQSSSSTSSIKNQ